MTEPVRVGVLGCADIARRRMLPALRAASGARLVAVASRDAAKARDTAAEAHCEAVTGYEALLERDDIDAVYVPLPAALHAVWVEAALRAGKHVLAEKPLTTDLGTTRRLVALAAGTGLVLRENVMFVHHPQHAAVRTLVADGAIGEVRSFRAEFTIPRLPDADIRYDAALGGGALWDTGVYPVRAALHLLGDQLEAEAAVLVRGGPGRAVDTSGTALLRTPQGVTAQLAFGLDHGYRSAYEITGSEGRVTVDRAFTPPAGHPPRILLERRTGTEEIALDPADQVRAAVEAFTEAVRTGAVAPDGPSLRQAELLEAVRGVARVL
ncbi:gfo/Idh/MocA family oxidoreductase [Streptomyces sp. WAC07061]|uniref:Gfo/Idh/MocA family protein n=1 Tax=Streptomyces sp. WAC07061 TaxID=2487410 RepID=UPI000F79F9D0|nr:Gfo/Idh/MocA family oxidoreductase [Streptomyces sp. WAC07061]RSS56021.1 gfo/Idh/MocA family oxidoreductase [Streptomyces sp. WAC07061]